MQLNLLNLLSLTLISLDIKCISSESDPRHIYHCFCCCCFVFHSFLLPGSDTYTHTERQQRSCEIRPLSSWLLMIQAARVLMTEETLEDMLLFVSLFPTKLQSDGGATSQQIRLPHPASPTAVPLCQFRNMGGVFISPTFYLFL